MATWLNINIVQSTPTPSPSSMGTMTPNVDGGGGNGLNWTLYVYMCIGMLCLGAIVALISYIVLQYANIQIRNRQSY